MRYSGYARKIMDIKEEIRDPKKPRK